MPQLPKEFWQQLPQKSDSELYDILAHAEDYLPEALAAAKEELHKRKLAPETAAQMEAAAHSEKLTEDRKAQEPLGWPLRIFIFLFCLGVAGLLLCFYYESKGYKRKAKEALLTWVVSVAVHFGIFALIELAHWAGSRSTTP